MNHASFYPDNSGESYTAGSLLQHEASEVLFSDVRFRPSAYTMASLICKGLAEPDILAAGRIKSYNTPVMDETLQDLDVAIPFIRQLSNKIANDHGDETIWLAARDFEAVADDLVIRYPELTAHLLPASRELLSHKTMDNHNLAASFLGKFGLTAAHVADPGKEFAIFDSGFHGSIGLELNDIARWLYGTSLRETDRLTNGLVSINTTQPIAGKQIMEFAGGAENFSEKRLPRASRIAKGMRAESHSDTQVLAVFLQTLPRFHSAYGKLADHNGSVVALPAIYKAEYGITYEHIDDNVDRPSPERDYAPNQSIVNPVAAAVVMYRVVKSALELKPDALDSLRSKPQSFVTPYMT